MHAYVLTSDAGSDQVKNRKLVRQCVRRTPAGFVFENNCFKHQFNITTKLGLAIADELCRDSAANYICINLIYGRSDFASCNLFFLSNIFSPSGSYRMLH